MKAHQKRHVVPKEWPIPRKGTTFVARARSGGIPLVILLRDVLKVAQNKREVKKAIHKKDLKVNGKLVIDERRSLNLFDVLTIVPAKKNYRLILTDKGKFDLEEIAEKESNQKLSKVVGKKVLKGKKIQINLYDGRNYLSDIKCKLNDSVIVDLSKNKIDSCVELKEKAKALVIGGKHKGEQGSIVKVIPERKMVELKTKEKSFNVLIKQLMTIN
jgi:small subunit ribosomal protein S4e